MSSKRKATKKQTKKVQDIEPKLVKKVKNNNIKSQDASKDKIIQQKQEEKTSTKNNLQDNNIFNITLDPNDKNQLLTISFGKRNYKFQLKNKFVKEDKQLVSILNELQKQQQVVAENYKKNQEHKIEEITKITDHYNFSALEYFLYYEQENIERKNNKIEKKCEEEKCCICQFELYDNLEEYGYNLDKFNDQLIKDSVQIQKQPQKKQKNKKQQETQEEEEQDLVIGLSECDGHFFHKNCLQQCIQEQHIKCPVCSRIYGIMTGDQPDGTMDTYLSKRDCDGFPGVGSIVINYSFEDGTRNGKYYTGTYRQAYLPKNEEGEKCLKLLKTAFDRRLIFTVGRSVTTGEENTTVWNGVHHKTNYSGGAAYFGYPDPTYFNRLQLELAMKGVF